MAAVERTQEESEEGGQMGGGVLSLEAAWTPLTARFCSMPKKKKVTIITLCVTAQKLIK